MSADGTAIWGESPAPQPYPYVKDGAFGGPEVPASVDPLVRWRWPDPRPDDDLQIYLQRPVRVDTDSPHSFEGLATLLGDSPSVLVKGAGTIRLDFGRENAAWFEIDAPDRPGGVRLSISEYNRPAYTNVGDKTGVPVPLGATLRAVFNPELYEGVRFAFVHVDEAARPWRITGARLVCQVKPVNYEGSFSASDPLLERAWHLGAYSVKLGNLREFTTPILIERSDRVLWNGLDFWIMAVANLVAFGAAGFVRRQIAKVNTPPGINCGIWSFELYDVLAVCDYFRATGDESLVRECLPTASAKVARADERWDAHPPSGAVGFLGWDERLGGFERVTPYNRWNYRLLCIRAWRAWAGVMEHLGEIAAAAAWRGRAEARIAEIRRDPGWHRALDVHGCAEAIRAGVAAPDELRAMVDGQLAERLHRVSYSPANTGLVVEALGAAGRYDDAVATIEDQWGAMLRYGGTTTFEMFHPSAADALGPNDPPVNGQCGMTSLCHPWGALPCRYLNEVVGGITATSPGFATVDVMPHLGRRLTRAAAVTPTPRGPVAASVDVEAGTGRVVLPPGVVGRVGVPKVERRIERISVNGRLAWDGAFHPVAGIASAGENDEFVVFEGIEPGTYDFLVDRRGVTPAPVAQALHYPARCLGEDRVTRGNWDGVHGRDGHVLVAGGPGGEDVRVLPPWIAGVAFERGERVVWATGADDPRAPAPGPGRRGPRTAAALRTKDPEPTYQTMTADVAVEAGREWTLALYFLDWDDAGRSVGVQVIDPVALTLLAPVQVVRSFRDGVYLSYRCRGPVRVRIDTITPPNATLTGMFFTG